MPDPKTAEITNWLVKANQDLQAAERLLIGAHPLTDIASFHSQQSAEKAIKAYLTLHETVFPKTHSLVALISLCLQISEEFEQLRVAAITLTPYAVASRYPGDSPNLTIEDAQQALALAQSVWQFILARIPAAISELFKAH